MNEQVLIAYYSINSGYDVVVGTHYICFNHFHCRSSGEDRKKKKHFCVCVSFAGRPEPCHAMSLQNPRLRHYRSNRQTRYTLMTVLFSFLKLVFSQFYYTYIYIVYIYADRYESRHTAIYFLSLFIIFFALSLLSLSLSLLFFSQISFYNHAQDVVQSYFFGVKSR